MNPWLSIWVKPRQTIRQIVDTDPRHLVLLLAMSAGAANVLMQALEAAASAGVPISLAVPIALGAGALFGVLGLYLWGWVYRWIGSWFGGQAKNVEVRAAIAWIKVPTLVVFGCWVVLMVLSGGQLGRGLGFAVGLIAFVAWVWQMVLACHTLGEVHRFSAWKGFGTLLIPNACLIVPVFFLALLAAIAIPNVLRARVAANESAAIGNLRALVASVELYRSVHDSYPDEWLTDMYAAAAPDYAPPTFNVDLQQAPQTVQSYHYRYTPTPLGCLEPNCAGYTLTSVPQEAGAVGTRSFFVDESAIFRHCRGGTGADATDAELEGEPKTC